MIFTSEWLQCLLQVASGTSGQIQQELKRERPDVDRQVQAVISSCTLPVAAVTLAVKILTLESYYRKTAVRAFVVIVTFSVSLSMLTGRKL